MDQKTYNNKKHETYKFRLASYKNSDSNKDMTKSEIEMHKIINDGYICIFTNYNPYCQRP